MRVQNALQVSLIVCLVSSSGIWAGDADIVDTAVSAGQFKTLVAAVKAAGLVETLKGEGPFTVFAPTDAAFAKLPKELLTDLLRPENKEKLTAILTYHVVPGRIVLRAQAPATVQGAKLKIVSEGTFLVNNAEVVQSDIAASNGVIHVIDTVLMPESNRTDEARSARDLIVVAIDRGVPLFNAGQANACAAVYEVTAISLLQSHAGALSSQAKEKLQTALCETKKTHDAREQAWILRRALDAAYLDLK